MVSKYVGRLRYLSRTFGAMCNDSVPIPAFEKPTPPKKI